MTYYGNQPEEAGAAAEAQLTGAESHGGPRSSRTPTFPVRATSVRAGKRSHGRGQLLISADAVVFSPFDWTGDSSGSWELVHTGRKVTITTALLRPPWADTFLILKDKKTGHVRAGTSVFARRRLRRALRESGVTVAQRTSLGPPPLPR